MFSGLKRAKLEKDPREQYEATLALLGTPEPEPMKHSSYPSSHVQVRELGPSNKIYSAISSLVPFGSQLYASNAEVAGLPFESLADAPRDSHTGDQCDLDTGACQADMQADFAIPMGDDEDMVEPPFGVLSNPPTFNPLFSYQPHPYGHSLDAQQDGLIVEDTGSALVADSGMEDVEMEGSQAAAP